MIGLGIISVTLQHSYALPDSPHTPNVTGTIPASTTKPDFGRVSLIAAALSREFSQGCPFAEPSDEAALKRCKDKLYGNSAVRQYLPDFVLWGRLLDENRSLKDTYLTQFGPDVFTAAYLPLFMFNGEYDIKYDEREKRYKIEFVTAFRNRLAPGQFPYPFWHNDNKWAVYQGANRLTVWVGIDNREQVEKIHAMQFSTLGKSHPAVPAPIKTPEFDKATHAQWLWTDATGKTQPQVTLFDGLFSANNPYLKRLDETYRAMAVELRNGECMNCHVPNNPDQMKRLVLLQTPAHAAAEIDRLIRNVREDKMPLDDIGIEKPMPTALKNALLNKAEAFQAGIKAAKNWESQQSR
ncbi:MAG: hypothetical protein JNM52_07270 [Betaproteobacteria bacterium]|nr:hypothetical protein [Betaproteobacteria bacterium]